MSLSDCVMLANSAEVLSALLDCAPLRSNMKPQITTMRLWHNIVPIHPDTGDSFVITAINNGLLDVLHALRGCVRDDIVSLANVQNKLGKSALHIAAAVKESHAVPDLVAIKNIDLNNRDKFGSTPLHVAAMYNNVEALRALLTRNDTKANSVDNKGKTALNIASIHGFHDIVEALLAHTTVDVNLCDYLGKTPLHQAMCRCIVAVCCWNRSKHPRQRRHNSFAQRCIRRPHRSHCIVVVCCWNRSKHPRQSRLHSFALRCR